MKYIHSLIAISVVSSISALYAEPPTPQGAAFRAAGREEVRMAAGTQARLGVEPARTLWDTSTGSPQPDSSLGNAYAPRPTSGPFGQVQITYNQDGAGGSFTGPINSGTFTTNQGEGTLYTTNNRTGISGQADFQYGNNGFYMQESPYGHFSNIGIQYTGQNGLGQNAYSFSADTSRGGNLSSSYVQGGPSTFQATTPGGVLFQANASNAGTPFNQRGYTLQGPDRTVQGGNTTGNYQMSFSGPNAQFTGVQTGPGSMTYYDMSGNPVGSRTFQGPEQGVTTTTPWGDWNRNYNPYAGGFVFTGPNGESVTRSRNAQGQIVYTGPAEYSVTRTVGPNGLTYTGGPQDGTLSIQPGSVTYNGNPMVFVPGQGFYVNGTAYQFVPGQGFTPVLYTNQ